MNDNDLQNLCIFPMHSIRAAMECIDRNSRDIVLMVDQESPLLGTITDGDVRRAILKLANWLDTMHG
jgi:signal-transduction protein with cAMP-binding, CBS, and nucleotidyltransferase domain